MSMINRFVLILILATIHCSWRAVAADADTNRVVVMISVDGLAGFYLDDPKAQMPTIRALAADGARASSMKASTPTVTWPNHTTLVTGDNPARHGVVGNNYFDRVTGKKVALISDPIYDKDEIVKVPTLYDVCHAAGMKTAGIRWPATRNAKTLDWTIPDMKGELMEKCVTPALIAKCEKAGIIIPGTKADTNKDEARSVDDTWTKIFNLILREDKPGFALLHVANVDHTEHLYGPRSPEAYAAIKAADGQVREVWEELKRDYAGRATLVVVSDHGFSLIKKSILPNVIMKQAGITSEKKTGGEVFAVAQGGSEFIYVVEQSRRLEIMKKVREAFTGMEGIAKIMDSDDFGAYGVANPKDDPHAPDMILFANDGYSFGDTAAGALPFVEKPERNGTHGHDPNLPNLHATFVAWGAGIKSGVKLGEISNIDVAPTLAKLMGVALPNTDGKPLAEILSQ